MTLKGYVNKSNNSSRIYTREDIGDMTQDEFNSHEKAIDYQMQNIGVPSKAALLNSNDVVFVHSYTRDNGVIVKEHYRSKSGFIGGVLDGPNKDRKGDPIFDETIDDSEKTPEELEKELKKEKEMFNFLVDSLVNIIPDGWAVKGTVSGFAEFVKQKNSDMLDMMYDPDGYMEKQQEAFGNMIKEWIAGFSNFGHKLLSGDFKNINWLETLKDLKVPEIASIANPLAGVIATLAIETSSSVLNAIEAGKMGDKSTLIAETMQGFMSAFGAISQIKGVIGNKLGDFVGHADSGELKEIYNRLGELENAGYRYEKLVSAELIPEAAKEMSKLQEITYKLTSGIKGIPSDIKEKFSNLKGSRVGGFQTGGASEVPKSFLPSDIDNLKNNSTTTIQGGVSEFDLNSQKLNFESLMKNDAGNNMVKFQESEFDPSINKKANELKNLASMSDGFVKQRKLGQPVIGTNTINDWKVNDVIFNPKTNFKAVVFEKGNEIIISYVGTDFKNINDHGANLKMAFTGPSKQMEEAEKTCRDIKFMNPNKQITLIGHSEGGSEAIYAGIYHQVPVITYNAYGVKKDILPKEYSANITNYRVSNDIVSKLRPPQGDTYIVNSPQNRFMAATPIGLRNGHQIQKMPNLERAIPEREYRKQNSMPAGINRLQDINIQMLQNQKINNAVIQKMARDGVFNQKISNENLVQIYFMYLMGY